ncbi:hypothetical protein [Amycolatopsis sp. NPDC059657]|uniref:hypothetical protein n=1 Tax=Amycolatopsis sp. NPDC059657 TaxID=3346899 RepID=UPI00366BA831
MTTAAKRTGKQAPPMPERSAFGCLMGCFMAFMSMIGPAMLWVGLRGDTPEDQRPIILAMGAGFTIITAALVIANLRQDAKARAQHRRLDEAGVRVLAEVRSSRRIWINEYPEPADELMLLVSHDGVPPFETRYVSEEPDRYPEGSRIPLDVDPGTLLFRVVDQG